MVMFLNSHIGFGRKNSPGIQKYPILHNNKKKKCMYIKTPGHITKQRHFREWIYFLYSASCFKYIVDGHLCFSTKLRSSTKSFRKRVLIEYILFGINFQY